MPRRLPLAGDRETEAVKYLEARGIHVAGLHGNSLRFLYEEGMQFNPVSIAERAAEQIREITIRNHFIAKFGFAILTRHTVEAMLRYDPILEVGAGSGYWSHELKQAGADIIATDPGIGRYRLLGKPTGWPKKWTNVLALTGVKAVQKFPPNRSLLLVWPDYQTEWPAETLKKYTGKTVLYVGEGEGGCTADDAFHELLKEQFNLDGEVEIPQFLGMHDRLEIWRR